MGFVKSLATSRLKHRGSIAMAFALAMGDIPGGRWNVSRDPLAASLSGLRPTDLLNPLAMLPAWVRPLSFEGFENSADNL